MSDNLVDFSLFVRREFPTRFLREATRSSGTANRPTSSLLLADIFQPAIAAPDLDLSTHERDRRQCP
jgi:hypothetical protein